MTKTVFRGRLMQVLTRTIRLPNGHQVKFELIRHPGAVLIVPFVTRDTIILLRQLRPVIGTSIYELPAGTLGRGEALRHCAYRELIEETGYAAGRLTRLGAIYPVPGYSTEKITIYKAERLRACPHTPERDEIITPHVMTRRAVQRLFRSGKIVDAKTISALAFCRWI